MRRASRGLLLVVVACGTRHSGDIAHLALELTDAPAQRLVLFANRVFGPISCLLAQADRGAALSLALRPQPDCADLGDGSARL